MQKTSFHNQHVQKNTQHLFMFIKEKILDNVSVLGFLNNQILVSVLVLKILYWLVFTLSHYIQFVIWNSDLENCHQYISKAM